MEVQARDGGNSHWRGSPEVGETWSDVGCTLELQPIVLAVGLEGTCKEREEPRTLKRKTQKATCCRTLLT